MDLLNNFSTREKNLWSELLVDVVAGLYYYPKMFSLLRAGDEALTGVAMASLITNTVMLAIFAGIIVSVFLHTQKTPEFVDERDQLFKARGNTVGYTVLVLCIALIMAHVIVYEMMPDLMHENIPWVLTPILIANLLLVSLFLASVIKTITELMSYRRGY